MIPGIGYEDRACWGQCHTPGSTEQRAGTSNIPRRRRGSVIAITQTRSSSARVTRATPRRSMAMPVGDMKPPPDDAPRRARTIHAETDGTACPANPVRRTSRRIGLHRRGALTARDPTCKHDRGHRETCQRGDRSQTGQSAPATYDSPQSAHPLIRQTRLRQ